MPTSRPFLLERARQLGDAPVVVDGAPMCLMFEPLHFEVERIEALLEPLFTP